MSNKVFYGADARERVLGGAEVLYKAVKETYGAKGRNVIIQRKYGAPDISRDGVSVAEAVDVPVIDDDTLGYKVGADLIKSAAQKLNKVAGDGTTTVTILTYNILKEANKLIAAGNDPIELRKGIESAAEEVIEALDAMTELIDEKSDRVAQIASISSRDSDIGDLIADTINSIGKDGTVTVEQGSGLELESDIVEGFSLDVGFTSPFFVTDTSRQEAVFKEALLIVTDKRLNNVMEIVPLMEKIAAAGKKEAVILADEVSDEVTQLLVLNKVKGVFTSVVVKAPSFGDRRKDILSDIAILTGATVISDETGVSFENAELQHLGRARRVIVGKDETTIINGLGSEEDVHGRLEQIKAQIDNAPSEFEQEQLSKRAASLQGKVAVLRVGGTTETEINEKKYRVDDAVAAVKAALAEGVVAGGGVTLVNIAQGIETHQSGAFGAGRKIVKEVLKVPFTLLMENAGLNAQALLAKVEEAKAGQGIDVTGDGKLVDMKKLGVIDPTRVTKEAIRNSVSIAATAATMGALVVEIPEATPTQPTMPY